MSERWRLKTSGKSDGIPVIPSTKRFAPLTRTRGERKKERGRGGGRETGESRWLWQWERRKHDEFIAEIRYARIGVARRRKHSRGETSADFPTRQLRSFPFIGEFCSLLLNRYGVYGEFRESQRLQSRGYRENATAFTARSTEEKKKDKEESPGEIENEASNGQFSPASI